LSKLNNLEFSFDPLSNLRLSILCGQFDENLRLIERRLGVEINNRSNNFQLIGDKSSIDSAKQLLQQLYKDTANETIFQSDHVHILLQHHSADLESDSKNKKNDANIVIKTKRGLIKPRGAHQQEYVQSIRKNDISFGIGPAGTGKTYLAVACAVDALERQEIRRIILTRPAVEAGERLGFLPGDLAQKVDPYLRPLYDALYEMLGFEKVAKLIDRNIIEVAPLAYMRGRTLNDAFIILDESQNTSPEQMKMFLTRVGFNSRTVITGDITQTDLPRGQKSGLRNAIDVLQSVKGIGFSFFQSADVVRHEVVQKVVEAYERHSQQSSPNP
jgi:phosphate starvation-inducible PhoH-like protein